MISFLDWEAFLIFWIPRKISYGSGCGRKYNICNAYEASHPSGKNDPIEAASKLHTNGADIVIVKLGAEGCWIEGIGISQQVPGVEVDIVDTTGAGDAFAAGLIASILDGFDPISACHSANRAGACVTAEYGCISAWLH